MPAPCGEVPAMMILSQHTISERLARGKKRKSRVSGGVLQYYLLVSDKAAHRNASPRHSTH